jgi:hypothetical protein
VTPVPRVRIRVDLQRHSWYQVLAIRISNQRLGPLIVNILGLRTIWSDVQVRLAELLQRRVSSGGGGSMLDSVQDWASILSLGEQQRLAFARCATSCCACGSPSLQACSPAAGRAWGTASSQHTWSRVSVNE